MLETALSKIKFNLSNPLYFEIIQLKNSSAYNSATKNKSLYASKNNYFIVKADKNELTELETNKQ